MWNLRRNDKDECTKQKETDLRMNLWLLGQRDSLEVWNGHVCAAIFKMDNRQRPTIWHMELPQCYMAAKMEGEFGGECIPVCRWLSPFTVHWKLSQHQLYPNIKQKVKKENSLSKIYLVGILLNNKKQQTLDTCREGNGNPLQYSCLENPVERSLVGCCPWGHTELDTTEVT